MLGAGFRGRGEGENLILREPRERDDLGEPHGPLRHRARLVQQDDIGSVRRLEDLASLEQDAELGARGRFPP